MSDSGEWIIVPKWYRFQSYGLEHRPRWVKNWTALLYKGEYLDLTLAERGLLHGIWLAYADREGRLRRRDLASAMGTRRVAERTIDSLQAKGFIELSTLQPLPLNLKLLENQDAPANGQLPDAEQTRARGATEFARQRAEAWIASGIAAEVPFHHLAETIAKDFKLEGHPIIVADLVARAMEMREGP